MKTLELEPAAYVPTAPEKKGYGIGIIGCGSIARVAHLPAYRKFVYNVVAICDLVEENLSLAQSRFGIRRTTTRIGDILNDEDVEIIDLAVHGSQRLRIVEQICAAWPAHILGILSQKPFTMSLHDARRMVELCRDDAIPIMVNQQARWAPAHRALKVLIERGTLGHLYCVIHFKDLCRYFTGLNPIRVKAAATKQPHQVAVTPMCHTILMEFSPSAQVMGVSHFNNIVRVPHLHRYEWFIDGIRRGREHRNRKSGGAYRQLSRHHVYISSSRNSPAYRRSGNGGLPGTDACGGRYQRSSI
jgi:predicted dehydrogenase